MKHRTIINIFTSLSAVACLYNLFSLKRLVPTIFEIKSVYTDIYYDISLAVSIGCIIYLLTSALPSHLTIIRHRKIYKTSLKSFIDNTLLRLKSIEKINYNTSTDQLREEFKLMKYGDQVKKGSPNSIYDVLISTHKEVVSLSKTCIPYIIAASDFDELESINNLIDHKLFNTRLKYLYDEAEALDNLPIGIGAFIKEFYDELLILRKGIFNE